MSVKLNETHLSRVAVVYIRQSSMTQVRENLESQRRQYDLAERAKALGFADVRVIDDDLGRSGSGSTDRPGFTRMLSLLCSASVGAIFVVEASRIARNARDWHTVVDWCAVTSTVLVDHDGIYDPRELNDRMLLGLKGAMAEYELGLIRQRSREALKGMLGRGLVMWRCPVGYVRDRRHRLDKTPDLQVQQSIQTVFDKFRELGSGRQVYLWLLQAQMQLPSTVKGMDGAEVRWLAPCPAHVLGILKNPFYAGTFAWPQRMSKTHIEDGRVRKKPGGRVRPEQWQVVLHGNHPGYITWSEFERNQALLMDNAGKGHLNRKAPRDGEALLAGLLRCGHCGLKLRTAYSRHSRYTCPGRGGKVGKGCLSFASFRHDAAVVERVLDAVQPLTIDASIQAWRELRSDEEARVSAFKLAAQKAEYEAGLARRRYEAVDPDNRLVATELERRWNEALIAADNARKRLDDARASQLDDLTEDDERRLQELGEDVARVWHHPDAPLTLKKRIVRTLVEEIVVTLDSDASELVLAIRWAGGAHTTTRLHKHRSGRNRRALDPSAIERLRDLAQICDDTAIARILNMNGLRTGPGNAWTEPRVRSYRERNGIPVFNPTRERTWLTMIEAARSLGVPPTAIRALIGDGALAARQLMPNAPWQIEREDLQHPRIAERLAGRKVRSRTNKQQGELFMKSTTYDG
ncbi:recombinase family protein, partial [Myxococcota bacterium]|nr:recombinase family protein [Myxococcota bacterium]